MDNYNLTEEKNLLIYDKTSKVGCIYFLGISSNLYRGKIILKKKTISDRLVRYTNLNDNLVLIKNGNFNFKQTAILIKGITIFLHRQLEVLLTDFYAMYKKCLFNNHNINNDLNKMMKKIKTNKGFKIKKKILSLQDVNRNNTELLMNTSNYLNKNKNIANVNDLMLKESNEIYINDYNFENDGIHNEENIIYQDILANESSFEYSKINNFYTVNDGINNLNTKESIDEIKMQSNMKNTFNFNLFEDTKNGENKNLEKNNYSTNSLITNINIDKKGFFYNNINSAITRNDGNINNKIDNNSKKVNDKKNNKKRFFVDVDEEIILKDNTWNELKINKKKKKSEEYFNENLENINYFFNIINNNKKNILNNLSFLNFYELTKNCTTLDSRKELYNVFENLIENEKGNKLPNNLKLIYTKSTISPIKGRSNNNLNFEELRERFNDDYFMNVNIENNREKDKISKNSVGSFINITDNIDYNFDKMSDSYNINSDQNKIKEQNIYVNNKNKRDNNAPLQNNNSNYTLSENFKDTISVPSSKLVNRRSFTSVQHKYDEELLKLKNYICKLSNKFHNNMDFENIFPINKTTDKNASLIFYNLLVLASNDEIELIQNFPNDRIIIKVF
ncbi:conserved Plasmodium protein, unknown function [Plasmodium gallinaceum]|uniref:Uncharacterized protein n=1 Tax=Plasmodium gallinaceum TaxID=5849 RepID=A0A1J1GYR9_PLAGA|nr:conserved Plasmodium protein, unknown function [Plasmodium gallinaceum]CRG97600.1 conserved Plasmodium protein, unknown function [Plasmodium gallinaceum]